MPLDQEDHRNISRCMHRHTPVDRSLLHFSQPFSRNLPHSSTRCAPKRVSSASSPPTHKLSL